MSGKLLAFQDPSKNTGRRGWLERRVDGFPRHRVVYFIKEDRPDGNIKIGVTNQLLVRFSDLQVGNSVPLSVVAWTAADETLECVLHGIFAEHLVRGEWFKPVKPILNMATALHGRVHVDWPGVADIFDALGYDTLRMRQLLREGVL